MVEKITIQPSKIRAYGNIINNKTTEDYDRYESSLVKSLVTINGVPISAYLLVYSPNNFAFDFDGNLKHLYVSEDEDTVEAFTFDSNNKELSFTSDDVSFGFDDTNKRLYCDNEYHPTSYSVSLNVSSSSVSVGGSVTLSATVLDDQETAVEGATVTFKVGGSLIDTATTNSSGVATLSYTCSVAGSLSFTASCNGANSTSQSVTVNKLSTSTALTSTGSSVTVGTSVTFTATVTSGGSGVNGLTVTFKDGTSTLGTGTTNSSGVATYTTNSLSVATHSITAVVTETGTYATSTSSAVSVVVSDHSYSLAFSQASYAATGGSATLSVTLLDNNVAVSGATVSVTGSDSSLYSGITNSSGTASVTVSNISSETTFTASYSGVTATCTVTVQSYLFYDACDTDNTNLYDTTTNWTQSSFLFDSTNSCYAMSRISNPYGMCTLWINDLTVTDQVKITVDMKIATSGTTNTQGGPLVMNSAKNKGFLTMIEAWSLTIGAYSLGTIDAPTDSHGTKIISDQNLGVNAKNYWLTYELIIDGSSVELNIYNGSTLIKTGTITSSQLDSTGNIVGFLMSYQEGAKILVKNIKVEAL